MVAYRVRRSAVSAITGLLLAVALFTAYTAQQAFATHTPADKVVASGSKVVAFAPGTNVTLLSSTLRTSKPSDLMLHVTLECSILTKLATNNDNPTANASGTVRAWVEVDDKIVPINDVSTPPQDPAANGDGDETDKVTFCNRTYERSVVDEEDPLDGIDAETDYIDTKTANAFNWLRLNVGNGVHKIEVVADLAASGAANTCSRDTTVQETCSEAYVGNRTLIVEPAKLANDATI
jgi:hypothetical protein